MPTDEQMELPVIPKSILNMFKDGVSLPPLTERVMELEERCIGLQELAREMLATLSMEGNAHLFEHMPSSFFDLLEKWTKQYQHLVE